MKIKNIWKKISIYNLESGDYVYFYTKKPHTIMYYYIDVINRYSDFSGRARRKEYWMFVLFNICFSLLAIVLDNVLGTTFNLKGEEIPYGFVFIVYSIFVFIPNIAVSVRRLHDIGKSGWFYFVGFIPFIGAFWLIILFCLDSQLGTNKWGENPKTLQSL